MKRVDGKRFGGRIAADLVEREQAVIAIEGVSSSDFAIIGPVNCCTFSAKRRTRGALCGGRPGLIRSMVRVSRRKSKMPSSAANQSARAFSIVSAISARSCAGRARCGQVGAIDREMQHVELERLPQAVGGIIARRVMAAGDARQQARQHGEFAGQQGFQHAALGFLQDRLEASATGC